MAYDQTQQPKDDQNDSKKSIPADSEKRKDTSDDHDKAKQQEGGSQDVDKKSKDIPPRFEHPNKKKLNIVDYFSMAASCR